MPRTCWTILVAAFLSSGLLLAQAGQETRLAGTVTDTTGLGLSATTVWVSPNSLSQIEINQLDTARKAIEAARLRLRAEQAKLDLGASVLRFVTKEQLDFEQAESQRTALELAVASKLRPERTVTTDAAGAFVLTGLAPGSYVIKVFRGGFEPSRLAIVEVKSGQEVRADVTIRPF